MPALRHRYVLPLLICLGILAIRQPVIGAVGLGDSEAYYWTWSQNLDLSYFDHPPAVAYVIRAGTGLFGDNPYGTRIIPTFLTTATLFVIYLVGEAVAGAAAGLLSMGVLISMPLFIVGSVAAAPDAILSFFTALALLFYVKARRCDECGDRRAGAYVMLAGLFFGLGFLAKYSALMLLPGVLASLARRENRAWFRRPAFYGGMALCLLAAVPVIAWNLQHGWSTVAYHFVARQGSAGFSLANLGKLVGGQLGYFSPFVIAGFVWSSVRAWRGRRVSPVLFEIALEGLPAALFFYLVILVTPNAEPHWPLVGYLPLAVVQGVSLAAAFASYRTAPSCGGEAAPAGPRRRSRLRALVIASISFSLFVTVVAHIHILTPLFVRMMPASYNPKYDLTNELYGWDAVGPRIVAQYRKMGGPRPFLLGYHYTFCSQLMFATGHRIETRCLNKRLDEFDFLPGAAGPFAGRDALYVRDNRYHKLPGEMYRFDSCEWLERIIIERGGRKVREFEIYSCRNYQGMK